VRKAFKYRLYPTRQQDAALSAMLETHRRLYNNALSERKQKWEQAQRHVGRRERCTTTTLSESASALRRAQRRVARRQKGSKRRIKAVKLLQKQHQRIGNLRRDFHHKTARALVMHYGTIVHEDLNIRGIARSQLAKSTLDVAWGAFLQILSYKAEEAGVTVIAVPPHNTTQAYSQCGALPDVAKTLRDRVHSCSYCGYVADRDLNAAQNILRLGSSLQDRTCANGRSVS
jgi:IS605 OrfB family transposase